MSLSELLCSQRRWGRARSRKLLSTAALSEGKRLGTLTERQRRLLVGALEAKLAAGRVSPLRRKRAPPERRRKAEREEPGGAPERRRPAATQIAGLELASRTKSAPKHGHADGARPAGDCGSGSRRSARAPRAPGRPARRAQARPRASRSPRGGGTKNPATSSRIADEDHDLREREVAPGGAAAGRSAAHRGRARRSESRRARDAARPGTPPARRACRRRRLRRCRFVAIRGFRGPRPLG